MSEQTYREGDQLTAVRAELRRLQAWAVETELTLAALVRAVEGVADLPPTVEPPLERARRALAAGALGFLQPPGYADRMNEAEYQAAQDRRADRLAAALLALEGLLGVIERHGLQPDPLDRMAIEKARAALAD